MFAVAAVSCAGVCAVGAECGCAAVAVWVRCEEHECVGSGVLAVAHD